jgi:hypothetical protein
VVTQSVLIGVPTQSMGTSHKKLPKTMGNIEDCKQVIRASGSVGANYTCPVK